MIPRHWQDVDFAEIERHFWTQAPETIRSQIIYGKTVTGRFAHRTVTKDHPVAYPPRHPATSIGE